MEPETDAAPVAKAKPPAGKTKFKETLAVAMAEQFSTCHAQVSRWFAMSEDDEEYEFAARIDALKLATRLVQASAAAARAVTQIKGEFHHHIHVSRPDYSAEKAAKKAREVRAAKAKQAAGDEAKRLDTRIDRVVKATWGMLTPEESQAIEAIWEQARLRRAHRKMASQVPPPTGDQAA